MHWLTKKQRWRQGPDLLLDIGPFTTFCSMALNSTSIIFIFIGILDDNYNQNSIIKIVRFDFESKQWTDIPKMGEKLQAILLSCAMTTSFDKQSTPNVMIVFNGNTRNYNNNSKRYTVRAPLLPKHSFGILLISIMSIS